MRSSISSPNSSSFSSEIHKFTSFGRNPNPFSNGFLKIHRISTTNLSMNTFIRPSRMITICSTSSAKSPGLINQRVPIADNGEKSDFFQKDGIENKLSVEVGNPSIQARFPNAKLSLNDQVFFLLAFIASTTSIAFTSLVVAAVPTLYAMARAATSFSKLADTAREELPSTMAAIRLSGMEISDLTLELSDLGQEIADGVNKSAQAVQAAEAGIRQIGSLARQQTISMIHERANLPVISIQPVVAGAAKKTSRAVGRATKTLMNIISRGEYSSDQEDHGTDRIEL